ncbi:MAG: RNA polymerase sigma factor [Pedobacter sp.]|nr:MAG: RNA polymerase sigma factor [Pedobacter sp.]
MIKNEVNFDLLYHKYKNLVFNLCLNYTFDIDDAADITQEVFVKVYQKQHQFDPESGSEKNWITGITINQCLDFLKAKRRKKRFGLITSLFYPNSSEPINEAVSLNHPGILLEQKEEFRKLLNIIYKLPNQQKTAVVLLKIEGRTQKEVAEIMGISVKAVESLFQRAKQHIRNKLSASEGF